MVTMGFQFLGTALESWFILSKHRQQLDCSFRSDLKSTSLLSPYGTLQCDCESKVAFIPFLVASVY